MTNGSALIPNIIRGKRPVPPLDDALKLLLKSDDEIRTQYLNLSPRLHKVLRDRWLEMEAEESSLRQRYNELLDEIEQLRAENAATLALLIECDGLLSEVTK